MDTFPKEGSGYPIRDLPQFWERPNNATSLEQVNPTTAAAGNRTQRLARHQASTHADQLSDEALGTKKSLK